MITTVDISNLLKNAPTTKKNSNSKNTNIKSKNKIGKNAKSK